MDVVLINSPLYDVDRPDAAYADPPPLGLGYIGTALRSRGHDVTLIDAVADGLSVPTLIRNLEVAAPDIIGVNAFSTNLHLVERIVSGSPKASKVLIGGPAARPLYDRILSWSTPSQLAVVIGEAEHAVPALLDGTAIAESIAGERARSVLKVNSESPLFPTSIDLPLDRSLFPKDPVFEPRWALWESHIVTSRGCGHDCAFCGSARSVNPGLTVRFRSEDHIAAELDYIRVLHPEVRCIRVLDDLFLRNPKFAERAARLFSSRNLKWRAMAHVLGLASAPRRVFGLLAASGCLELFMGVESGSPGRRRQIGKPEELAPTKRVIRELLAVGIAVKAYLIFGFPGETELEMQETFAFAEEMAHSASTLGGTFRASAFKFRPYHGTRLYDELVAMGHTPIPLHEDRNLAGFTSGRPYDFTSDNFSTVPTDRLNQFIANTIGLNP